MRGDHGEDQSRRPCLRGRVRGSTSRNPLNPKYSTGELSFSGSGAAVAGGMVDVALGGDEGGSIRIPSAWCGLVGMKATHGLVPSYGMTYMDHTIDHIGPMTRTVTDNARMLEVIAGTDWRDPQWVRATPSPSEYLRAAKAGISGLRIGVVPEAESLRVALPTFWPPSTGLSACRVVPANTTCRSDCRSSAITSRRNAATRWDSHWSRPSHRSK